MSQATMLVDLMMHLTALAHRIGSQPPLLLLWHRWDSNLFCPDGLAGFRQDLLHVTAGLWWLEMCNVISSAMRASERKMQVVNLCNGGQS